MTTQSTMHEYVKSQPSDDTKSDVYISDVAGPVTIPPMYDWDNPSTLRDVVDQLGLYLNQDATAEHEVHPLRYNADKRSYVAKIKWRKEGRDQGSRIVKLFDSASSEDFRHNYLTARDISGDWVPRLYTHRYTVPLGMKSLVMEDLSSSGRFSQKDQSMPEKLTSLIKAAECLEFVHKYGGHGDIKLGNFMGSQDDVRIIDFESFRSSDRLHLTPQYAAPEMMRMYGLRVKSQHEDLSSAEGDMLDLIESDFDARANDVYSFGVVVQRLLGNSNLLRKHRMMNKNDPLYEQLIKLSSDPHGIYVPTETNLHDLVRGMHDMNPKNRPSIFEVRRGLMDAKNKI